MKNKVTYPFEIILQQLANTGLQMTNLSAAEASAGNLSVYVDQFEHLEASIESMGIIDLPVDVPSLSGGWLLITATGSRLRDIYIKPKETICVLKIQKDGKQAELYAAPGVRPTSELNSHLAIHDDQITRNKWNYHALVHAQPPYITYLSHLERYAQTEQLNQRLLRWEPETILTFPEGIGTLPFEIPGSPELMRQTVQAMQVHRLIIWQRHGVVSRSEKSLEKAADYVEYAETAAHYEYLNLQLGEPSRGLSDREIRAICEYHKIVQSIF